MPRRRTALASMVTAAAALLTLTGCVTVHGEQALVPAAKKAEAQKVLDNFAEVNNKANRKLDPALNATVETGGLGAVDGARIKALKVDNPGGQADYPALELSDARFLVPRQRGWPRWFVADAANNRSSSTRWLMGFLRTGPDDPWKASYLSVLSPQEMPDFVTDADGYAEPVALTGSDLLVQPGKLSAAYTGYLQAAKTDSTVFADGDETSVLRASRAKEARTATYWTQYVDQAADRPAFAPIALRTKDGGALVFFCSHHRAKKTAASGLALELDDKQAEALLTGTLKSSLTQSKVSEQIVKVPAKAAGDGGGKDGAKVVFVNRIQGLVTVEGE